MALVRVVNVRGLRTPEEKARVVYVGRSTPNWPCHPLHNPFKLHREFSFTARAARRPMTAAEELAEERAECLKKYEDYLRAMPADQLRQELTALWEETGHGKLALGCWCVNWDGTGEPETDCHAVVLARLLADLFGPARGAA